MKYVLALLLACSVILLINQVVTGDSVELSKGLPVEVPPELSKLSESLPKIGLTANIGANLEGKRRRRSVG